MTMRFMPLTMCLPWLGEALRGRQLLSALRKALAVLVDGVAHHLIGWTLGASVCIDLALPSIS